MNACRKTIPIKVWLAAVNIAVLLLYADPCTATYKTELGLSRVGNSVVCRLDRNTVSNDTGLFQNLEAAQTITQENKINLESVRETVNGEEKCYSPTLPKPKYLDFEQKRLASKRHLNWSDLTYFPDAKDVSKPELHALEYNLKPWAANERTDIEGILDRIWHIVPGLLIRAASGGQLAICKTSIIRGDGTVIFSAKACPCAIVITNSFFTQKEQFLDLVHELVHESDLNGRVANSKEWVRFINPKVARLRTQIALSPSEEQQLANEARRNKVVPTLYSCQNLNEALAEITSAYVGHSGFRTPSKFNKFGRRVLLPDDCAARNDMQFKKGVIQFSNGDASAAIHTLLPVIESEPNLATPHAVLAASYAKTSDLSHALQQLEGAMKCFSAAGVPWTEPSVDFARRWLPFCDGPSAYFYQDVGPSNETLLNIPFEFSALFHRFQIEEHQKKYAAAACDLYWYRFGSGLAWLLRDGGTEPYIVGQELNRKVENSHGISTRVPLMCRAHFFEWLGDKKKNVREGRDLYRRALADYRNAFELDRSRKEVLLDCCTVSLKLNDKVAAERYESQGLTEHPDAIETQIMHIQILNAQGKQTNTEEAYKQFIRENLGKILRPE